MQLYIDTLNQLSTIIEESRGQAPYMVLGDMNTELSNKATLNKNWYKRTGAVQLSLCSSI